MSIPEPEVAPSGAPPLPQAAQRSLTKPFNRAGAPSIADLGFDAQPDTGSETDEDTKSPTSKDLIGFPGERVPHISFGFEGERWRIRNVVWVIGQSATGAQMLDHTYLAGYRIGFDGMVNTGERLQSFTNLSDRVITLDSRANPEQLVVMLAYALALGSAAIDGVFYDSPLSPPAALLAARLCNAYAIALQMQICFELRTSPTLPESSDREVYWRLIAKEQPRLSSGFAQMALNEMALTQGAAMAATVREYYGHKALRESYDTEVINYFRSLPANLLKDPKSMTGSFDPAAQVFKLKFPAVSYAVNHEPKLDLKAPANLAASTSIAEAITELQAARRNAGVKDRETWHVQTD